MKDEHRLAGLDKGACLLGQTMMGNERTITLALSYRPPYAWGEMIEYLAGRAIPGVELVKDGAYSRTALVKSGNNIYRGWISVTNMQEDHAISIAVSSSLLPILDEVLVRVRKLFDLDCDPAEIYSCLSASDRLLPIMSKPGLRLPGCFDPFEVSVRAILGQQVTVKAARTLAMRFAHAFGETVSTPFDELQYTFPTSGVVLGLPTPIENQLGPLGITGARSRSIRALAEAIETGSVCLSPEADSEATFDKLSKLPGFGPWTVQYVAMRAFSWPDAFPHADYGVKKALSGLTEREILRISQEWKPWRSYATLYLWNSLKGGKPKEQMPSR